MTPKAKSILLAFAAAIAPESPLSVSEWAGVNVTLARSSRSSKADLSQTPWLTPILEAAISNDHSDIVAVAPVGSGKTTFLEILGTYIVAEKPGPALILCQTDSDAQEWMATGLQPALQSCPAIAHLWPKNRYRVKRDFIHFPHMPLWVSGANISSTQSKSVDWAIGDEVVFWNKPQLIGELAKRRHDRPFAKMILVSQPLLTNDPFALHADTCQKMEWHYRCPNCGEHYPYRWENLKFEPEPHYACQCGHTIANNPTERRALSAGGTYLPIDSPGALAGRIAFTYNALAVWWIDWNTLRDEWHLALAESKKGNHLPLQQFRNKRLAQCWDESEAVAAPEPKRAGTYSLKDREKLTHTFLTIDCQEHRGLGMYFYFVVRTWDDSGNSRLIDCGKLPSFEAIKQKQEEWEIPAHNVGIDSAFRTEEVLHQTAANGWLGLNGVKETEFIVKDRTGRISRRIYSQIKREQTASGGISRNVHFSSHRFKSLLASVKNKDSWAIPFDVDETYLAHLSAERFIMRGGKGVWESGSRRKDFNDCEVEQLVLACFNKCFVLTDSE